MQKLKTFLTTIAASVALLVPVAVPAALADSANIQGNLCQGTQINLPSGNGSGSSSSQCSSGSTDKLDGFLQWVVNIFSAIVGIIAVIMIIVGGLRYITSGGDSGKVGSAKNTLLYAIIGLIIVALAQVIVHFVIGRTTQSVGSGF